MKQLFSSAIRLIRFLLISVIITSPVRAEDVNHSEARTLRESGKILPLETILEKSKAFRQGEAIDTELERDNGMLVYEIEILDDQGRVWELEFDATNGDLLELELDD